MAIIPTKTKHDKTVLDGNSTPMLFVAFGIFWFYTVVIEPNMSGNTKFIGLGLILLIGFYLLWNNNKNHGYMGIQRVFFWLRYRGYKLKHYLAKKG